MAEKTGRNAHSGIPAPDRASPEILKQCRARVDGPIKAAVRKALIPLLRWKYGLAELGEGFHWARDGRMAFGSGSRIGRYAYVGTGFEAQGPVIVGDLCMISAGCKIVGADHTFETPGTPTRLGFPKSQRPPTVFELDCWIGRDVLIMEGVRIGAGAIVGSGALVTRDVASYTIVGGVPARPIRDRFSSEAAQRHDCAIRQSGSCGQ